MIELCLIGRSDDFGGYPRVGVAPLRRSRQQGEHPSQVCIRFKPIGLGRLDERVKVGARLRALDCVTEQPVFPARDERSDGVLAAVVIDLQTAVFAVANEPIPLENFKAS